MPSSQVADSSMEAKKRDGIIINSGVVAILALKSAILGVENLGVQAQSLAVPIRDDFDVLFGRRDRGSRDNHSLARLVDVEHPGADFKDDVGGRIRPLPHIGTGL